MALPTILVDSTNGAASDTACSGAGPTTALTGTAGATDGAGTTVTLDALTDLSGVDTTGLHVIYLADTTAGHRRFAKITGKAGSGGATPTVTVAEAFTALLTTKSWAIGGVRATVWGSVSTLLFDNNGAAGDAMPGWTVQMQSGHTETVSATVNTRRSGTTAGAITLQGAPAAVTMPVITFSNNGNAFVVRGEGQVFQYFDLRNSNATKTASIAFISGSLGPALIRGCKIAHSTNKFWKACVFGVEGYKVVDSEIGYCANIGIDNTSAPVPFTLINSWVHDCGATGVSLGGALIASLIYGNIIANNAGDGLNTGFTGASYAGAQVIAHNTFYNNTGDGLELSAAGAVPQRAFNSTELFNNIFANNGGYGVNLSGASITDGMLAANLARWFGNDFYTNTSGAVNPAGLTVSQSEQTTDPTFTNAGAGDFSIGPNLASKGYPVGGALNIGTFSSTASYVDIGVAQRQPASGSSIGAQIFGG